MLSYHTNVYLREAVLFVFGATVLYTLLTYGPPGGALTLAWGLALLLSIVLTLHSTATLMDYFRRRRYNFHHRQLCVLTEEILARLTQLDITPSSFFYTNEVDIPIGDDETILSVRRTAHSYHCSIRTEEVIDYDSDDDVTTVRHVRRSYLLPLGTLQGLPKVEFREWIEQEDSVDFSHAGFFEGVKAGFRDTPRWHPATFEDLWVLYKHLRESSYQT